MCGKPNPEERETCSFCQARLKPLIAPSPGTPPIRAGQEPLKKPTSDLERASLGGGESIPAGQEPTKKNTAELEQALPSWLRSLRQGQEPQATEKPAAESAGEGGLPLPSAAQPAPEEDLPDWLAGLGAQAEEEEEELPDWLAGIRGKVGAETGIPASEEPITHPLVGAETLDRLGSEGAVGPPEYEIASGRMEAEIGGPEQAAGGEELPDWLSKLEESVPAAPEAAAPVEGLPDWLKGTAEAAPEAAAPAEGLPDWLKGTGEGLPTEAAPEAAAPAEGLPDWLKGTGEGLPTEAAPEAAVPSEALPDWLSKLEQMEGTEPPPAATPAFSESLPDWLSGEAQAGPQAPPPAILPEQPSEESPAWLPEGPAGLEAETPAGPLPDWLAEVEASAAPTESAAPAFVMGAEEEEIPPEAAAPVFAMETPDWLSSLRPEEGSKPFAEETGQPPSEETGGEIAPAELPSWVQAMRPVEAVVSEVELPETEEEQVVESQGPLAGLRGVLPAAPGLGAVRKPPPYSIKLRVDEAQQRYAAYLEQLVTRENQPRRATAAARAGAANWLRWLIALLLLLVVGLPLLGGMRLDGVHQFLTPPDVAAASDLVSALPDNAPVLVAFDYQPALAGELEAAAGPLMHHLFYRGARLTLVSTNPMGPALAEHFMGRMAETHNFQPADRYLNLGYLAGGAAGVFDFILYPLSYVPSTGAADPLQSAPLRGVQQLSDYALIVVLTDDADTGRIWVEQLTAAGLHGEIPLVMVVSAQAEPMMRPYYDSRQMDGLVSGLAGARFYEQRVSLPVETTAPYWSAFSLGMLLVVITLAVGGAWNAVQAWRNRKPVIEEKED